MALIAIFATSTNTVTASWFSSRPFKRVTAGGIETERWLIGEGEPQQEYHDEVEGSTTREFEAENENSNTNGNRPRIELSGLLNAGEWWREDEEERAM